ncbi:Arc family DNA-binding protein [Desulfosporosinus sp. FKA]|uniref:Arc family DNA-binding protein n=1 Tax=Desulfosporosinus sp. FKA TaxID=1969834 RepID=UPI000B499598|nr:Arc family DNA-binding protein [Desulfosporosinus sp. FKA]
MPTARTKANRKYNEKAYDRVALTVPKGQKEVIKDFAEKNGLSLNSFINEAIQEKMSKKDAE